MKSKTFAILILICAVLGGAAYFVMEKKPQQPKSKLGEKLFETLPVNEIQSVSVKTAQGSVKLRKGEKIWGVEDRFNYPANYKKLTDLIMKIRDVKIGRSFPSSDDTLSRQGLYDPELADKKEDEKGTRVIFEGTGNKVLADLIIGKTREGSAGGGGQYIKPKSGNEIYMVDKDFQFFEKNSSDWIEKELLKVNAEDVEEVACINPKDQSKIFVLKRKEKGSNAELTVIPEGRTADRTKMNNVISTLANFQVDDVADPASEEIRKGFAELPYLEYKLFDGTIYKIYPGKALAADAEKYYVKAEVTYIAPPTAEKPAETKTEKDAQANPSGNPEAKSSEIKPVVEPEKKPEAKPEEPKDKIDTEKLSKDAAELNLKISPWIYVMPKWRYENLITQAESLLTPPPEPEKAKDSSQ